MPVNPFQQRLLRLALRRRVQRADGGLEQRQRSARATGGKVSDRSARSSAARWRGAASAAAAFGAGIDGVSAVGSGASALTMRGCTISRRTGRRGPRRARSLAHLLAGVEIQPAQLQLTAVVGQRGRQLAPGPVQHLGLGDLAFDLCGKARPQRGDRDYAGFILVAQRQVQHEVFGRHQSRLRSLRSVSVSGLPAPPLGCARAAAAAAGMEERASVMKCPGGAYRTRMASTSNCAPLGRLATPMVERAGKG